MWGTIIKLQEWFGDISERNRTVRNFNKFSRASFIGGQAVTLLEAKISGGNSDYRHAFSKWRSGFRITALSGHQLTKGEMVEIGRIILDNSELVRKLLALGFDTLEVQADSGFLGVQWKLSDFSGLGGILE